MKGSLGGIEGPSTAPGGSPCISSSASVVSISSSAPISSSSSTTSPSTSSSHASASSAESPLCRDYVRNVCYRGSSCKYSHHRSSSESRLEKSLQNAVLFCHDFQNKDYNCPRTHCKFIHATKEEEETFKASGYLPPLAKEEAIRKGMAPDLPAMHGQKPFCKDFLKNSCSRSSCKFRHISPMQYDLEMSQCLGESLSEEDAASSSGNGGSSKGGRRTRAAFYGGGSSPKYPRLINSTNSQTESLKRINHQLKQQVEDLKKRVTDLSTTNEFLLDQNARLRRIPPRDAPPSSGLGLPCLEACSSPVVHPSVTLTQVSALPQHPPPGLVNPPSLSQQPPPRIDPSVTSINLRPAVSLAPNSALVQETRFLSYPITSILPPMQ